MCELGFILPKESFSEPETLFTSLGLSTRGGNGGRATRGDRVLETGCVIGVRVMADVMGVRGDGMMGEDGMIGDGMVGTALMIELWASFCSDELFDPGLTVGSGRFSSLNLLKIN